MSLWTKTARSTLLIIAAGALLGWRMAELEPGPLNSASVTAYGGLCAIVLLLLWLIWKKFGAEPNLGRIALTAFGLRLVLGVALSVAAADHWVR